MAAPAVLHFNIASQMTTTVPGTKTVWRTATKSCGECSPGVPGVPREAKSADFIIYLLLLRIKKIKYDFLVQKGYKIFTFLSEKDTNCYFFRTTLHNSLLFCWKKT